jgi:hypothetical protein
MKQSVSSAVKQDPDQVSQYLADMHTLLQVLQHDLPRAIRTSGQTNYP